MLECDPLDSIKNLTLAGQHGLPRIDGNHSHGSPQGNGAHEVEFGQRNQQWALDKDPNNMVMAVSVIS